MKFYIRGNETSAISTLSAIVKACDDQVFTIDAIENNHIAAFLDRIYTGEVVTIPRNIFSSRECIKRVMGYQVLLNEKCEEIGRKELVKYGYVYHLDPFQANVLKTEVVEHNLARIAKEIQKLQSLL